MSLIKILQRSNYSEPSASLIGISTGENDDSAGGRSARGKAHPRQAISDNKVYKGLKKKKSTMHIRTAILYKKSFAVLLEESVGGSVGVLNVLTHTKFVSL